MSGNPQCDCCANEIGPHEELFCAHCASGSCLNSRSAQPKWTCPDGVCQSEAEHWKLLYECSQETWLASLRREQDLKQQIAWLKPECDHSMGYKVAAGELGPDAVYECLRCGLRLGASPPPPTTQRPGEPTIDLSEPHPRRWWHR